MLYGTKASKMKRKRKESCPSPILDESPKRTKVQAQRKFAQNSGVHSPIITPIRDLETIDQPHTSVLPEPVELLPMKRPNTEDFLTFLCFRGTPILPPSLQFFNTASIVADGQVHEIKGDCPKNGPIDIAKCAGSSSEKPFIAFGVRKRADPIVISRQMERKRRHALAIQALRRKYQEQKMAKIRALTISKLSEKTTNKTLVKTNTIQKTETVTKKTNTLQKTKVIATKHVKVTTQTLKTNLKPRMCLRSFRGKFVHKELPFRPKKPLQENEALEPTPNVKGLVRTSRNSNKEKVRGESSSNSSHAKVKGKPQIISVVRSPMQRPQIKRRIILPSTIVTTKVKPKLRSTTMKKTVISRRKAQQRLRSKSNHSEADSGRKEVPKKVSQPSSRKTSTEETAKKSEKTQESSRRLTRRDSELANKKTQEDNKKEIMKSVEMKRDVKIAETSAKKLVKKNVNLKKEFNLKTKNKDVKKNVALQKTSDTVLEKKELGQKVTKDLKTTEMTVRKVVTRKSSQNVADTTRKSSRSPAVSKKAPKSSTDTNKEAPIDPKTIKQAAPSKETSKKEEPSKRVTRDSSSKDAKPPKEPNSPKKPKEQSKKECAVAKEKKDEEFSKKIKELIDNALRQADEGGCEEATAPIKIEDPEHTIEEAKVEPASNCETEQVSAAQGDLSPKKDEELPKLPKKPNPAKKEDSPKRKCAMKREESEQSIASSRPSRKTKEAAAIYMELLSHKLVNDNPIDDDNVSIDSFPELPNVKRTEQREIELKAQAKTSKDEEKKQIKVEESAPSPKANAKRRPNPITIASDDDSDNEVLQAKVRKSQESATSKAEETESRRQTRRSNKQTKESDSDPSDESFHVDVRVPRKKKNTRSRSKAVPPSSVLETNVDIILEAARVLEAEMKVSRDSDSDESTTSDINLKSLQAKQRNKKLSKTKSSKSSAFSDSDEEPLAKLKTANETEDSKKKPRKTADKSLAEVTVMEPKPKRECAKRPSYYLPMLSSSDEEEDLYFHGFKTSKEDLNKPKVLVQTLAPSLDLLSKDIGRKGKVNMSNEQIEQWLKDSAMAGSSVEKENDAMLKFGEKIPPKVVDVSPPKIPDLKPLDVKELKMTEPQAGSSKADLKPKTELKSPMADRKWIFKKDKKEFMPNKNAFSPENECSVYAFGEENEDTVSTPFRRPSRRPSSTATSRSEDELSKNDDPLKQFRKPNPSDSEDSRCFNIPQNPAKLPMVPPSGFGKRQSKPSVERFPEPFDDCKYKVPSSPSASSGSSANQCKKGPPRQKPANPVYVSEFPKTADGAKLVEAPVFHPTEQEFQDPLEYIERIRHKAEQFGICKIVPPSGFKPECKVSDDMRFTAYNQYVHKMLHRWGPNFKEFIAIRKYLATQSIFLKTPPLIGGMEIDLPRLYQTVQSLGGLKEVIEKKKWSKVSDHMKIPKSAQDRVTKLDDIYCKYLLPYDTLSPAEREKLFDEVETYWAKRESKNLEDKAKNKAEDSSEQEYYDSDDNEIDECTVKGKNMALNAFYRIARNTMSMYFKVTEPTALEVEQEFWRYVTQKQNHICVHSASIDCGTWGYGFAVSKNSPFAKHAWNLKVLSNNSGSVLRSLGPVMGVTIPTLHVGMVFSACCWYRDPHGLPWVEYLHTGGNKIWYGIPSSSCEVFHAAMQKLVPNYCRDKELWLPSDTAMVPPGMLMENNVSLCRTIQEPGQFMVVFPKVFTSSISTGYVVSESVYFASLPWLKTAKSLFSDLKTSCEPSMFSLDKLLVSISNDNRSSVEVLRVILPFLEELCTSEKTNRLRLRNFGKIEEERVSVAEQAAKKRKIQSVDGDYECEVCRMNLYISMVVDTQEDLIYCLEDALVLISKNPKTLERFKFRYSLDEAELDDIPKRINSMIEAKMQKKVPGRFAGLPTLLK